MTDRKEKLFTEKDFDKEPYVSKSWLQKNWKWCALLGACVVIVLVLLGKANNSKIIKEDEKNDTSIEPLPLDTVNSISNSDEESTEIGSLEDETMHHVTVDIPKSNNSREDDKKTGSSNKLNVTNDVEAEAMKVIRGDYGVGQERKNKLGTQYQPIQNRVNQLKRDGVF